MCALGMDLMCIYRSDWSFVESLHQLVAAALEQSAKELVSLATQRSDVTHVQLSEVLKPMAFQSMNSPGNEGSFTRSQAEAQARSLGTLDMWEAVVCYIEKKPSMLIRPSPLSSTQEDTLIFGWSLVRDFLAGNALADRMVQTLARKGEGEVSSKLLVDMINLDYIVDPAYTRMILYCGGAL